MMDIVSVQGLPFLSCLLMLAILGYIGIHVLKREIIFIDIALAQIAAVGAIAAHVVFHLHEHSILAHALAFGSTLVAAAFFAVVRRRVTQIPLEAVIGVSYAVSAAAALFLVGVAPGGHVHVQEMLAGSILWATWSDVLWSAGVFAGVGLCFFLFRVPFRTISDSYDDAIAKGYRTVWWDFLFYALVGIVITMAVRVAGVVVVFAFLIIPATLSAAFASGWAGRLAVAWVGGAVSTALGLLFADRYDFSVGPAIALFLGVALVAVGLLRLARATRTLAAGAWLAVSVALGAWFVSDSIDDGAGLSRGPGGAPRAGSITHAHSHDTESAHSYPAEPQPDDVDPKTLSALADVGQLESMYAQTTDADGRSMIACRLLEVDLRAGARAAISFLSGDPPLLFRMTVVDKLEEVSGWTVGYDIDKAFHAPSNERAVATLKEAVGLADGAGESK